MSYIEYDTPTGKLLVLDTELFAQFQTFLEDAGIQHWFTNTSEDYDWVASWLKTRTVSAAGPGTTPTVEPMTALTFAT